MTLLNQTNVASGWGKFNLNNKKSIIPSSPYSEKIFTTAYLIFVIFE